jgi:hypothetical protein
VCLLLPLLQKVLIALSQDWLLYNLPFCF